MASQKKKFNLTEIDLAHAATAPTNQKKSIVTQATSGNGYDFYRAIRDNSGAILNLQLPLVSASPVTREETVAAVGRACYARSGEIEGNEAIAAGLWDYVDKHKVTAANLDLEKVFLGPAGRRWFWAQYILKIDGEKYIPFFDWRKDTGLSSEGRRFVFSVNHAHIRLANPTEYGDVGLVIFQFEVLNNKTRRAVAHFDDGISFWSDTDISQMIDDVYRVLDEVRRAA
jgi:hypothetical protein